jgi:hypothetical protein
MLFDYIEQKESIQRMSSQQVLSGKLQKYLDGLNGLNVA